MEIAKMNIFQKINKVMEEIEYLQKDDKVVTNSKTGVGYKAVSEEKVTTEVRKALVKYGIDIIPVKQEHKREDEILKDQYGSEKANRLTTVDITYRIQNIDDKDDYIEAVSSGTGVDTQDKGIGKAMTYAYKYLLLRTFAIPTGEDADKTSSESYDEQFDRNKKTTEKITKATPVQVAKLLQVYTGENLTKLLQLNNIQKIEDMPLTKANELIKSIEEKGNK